MAEKMTLEQVRDELRYCAEGDYRVPALVLAVTIDAHLAQPAQAVDMDENEDDGDGWCDCCAMHTTDEIHYGKCDCCGKPISPEEYS